MSDHSADSLDFASEVEMAFREAAIEAVRKQSVPPSYFDGFNCIECEEPIPPERLALVKFTCISCQEWLERKKFFRL